MQPEAEADPDSLEAQPLLRNNRNLSRENFQAAEREAVRTGVSHLMWLSFLLLLTLVCVVIFLIYVEVRTWIKVLYYWGQECDTPIWTWLLVRALLGPVASPLRLRSEAGETWQAILTRLGHALFQVTWLVLGYYWKSTEVTCRRTHPGLYDWVNFLTILSTVIIAVCISFVVLLYCAARLFVYLMHIGWIKNPKAASDDTIDRLEVVEYRQEYFASGTRGDDQPDECCCCCMEEFNAEKCIVKTPCDHHFHKECLKDWLKLACTCPLCRTDLEEAVRRRQVQAEKVEGSGNPAQASTGSSDGVGPAQVV